MEINRWVTAAMAAAVLAAAVLSRPPPTTSAAHADAATLFRTKCAICHGADGSGSTTYGKQNHLRDLRSAQVQRQSDDQLFSITAKGKGKMRGYETSLGADKCRELVAFVRTLKR